MLKFRHALPAFAFMLTSMAYGQMPSFQRQPIMPSNLVDETSNLQARLQATSVYSYENGAFAAQDSVRLFHMNGKNASQLWMSENPFNILNTQVGFEYNDLKHFLTNVTNKNVDTAITYFWSNSLNNWDIDNKVQVTDNYENKTIARTTTVNNASLMEKQNRSYEFYNENNKLDSVIVEDWNGTDWVKVGKAQFVYDTLNTEPSIELYNWNDTNGEWDFDAQYSVIKDGDKHKEFQTKKMNDSLTLITVEKVDYAYDVEGNLISKTFSKSEDGSTFTVNSQELYMFDLEGKHIQSENSTWDNTNSVWVGDVRNLFEYNAEGKLENVIYQSYNGSNFQNVDKKTLVYTNDVLTSVEYSYWNSLEWSLVNRMTIEDLRDGNGGKVITTIQDWNTGNFWELNNGNTNTNYYFEEYNDDGTKIQKLPTAQISLYPNPTQNDLNIEVANAKIQQVNIFNISGALVMSVKTNAVTKTNVEISNLNTGLYQIQVVTDNGVGTQKLNVVK